MTEIPKAWKILTEGGWFIEKRVDAWLLVSGLVQGHLFGTFNRQPVVESGFLCVYKIDINKKADFGIAGDGHAWDDVDFDPATDFDASISTYRSCTGGSMMKKEMLVKYYHGEIYRLVSYYDPWEAVSQRIKPPRYDEFSGLSIPDSFRGQDATCLSPTEKFRTKLAVSSCTLLHEVS